MKPYTASLTQQADVLVYDLRQRINPQYADQRGTESYERKECADMIDALRQRVQELEAAMYINPQKVDTSEPTCIDIGGHPV
jgi:uncharacterized protein YaaN involved in tellurite resistance